MNEKEKPEIEKEKEIKIEKLEDKICHICYDESNNEPLMSPCKCIGSMQWVHHSCIKKWLFISNRKDCCSCKYIYKYEKKYKRKYFKYLDNDYSPKIATISSILLGIVLSGLICYIIYFRKNKNVVLGFNFNYVFFSIKAFLFIFLGLLPILHFCKILNLREAYNSYISLYERENLVPGQGQNFTDIYVFIYITIYKLIKSKIDILTKNEVLIKNYTI